MSAREPMTVRPQARTRVGLLREPAMDGPVAGRRAEANCGACGRLWFGHVAYCPYCGRRSARVPDAVANAPASADREAADRAHDRGPARAGMPQGPDARAPGARWADEPVLEPGFGQAASAPAPVADERAPATIADGADSVAGGTRRFGWRARAGDPPGMRWMAGWKPIAALSVVAAAALAMVPAGVEEFTGAVRDEAGPPGSGREPVVDAGARDASGARERVAAPRAATAAAPAPAAPGPGPAATAAGMNAPPAPAGEQPAGSAQSAAADTAMPRAAMAPPPPRAPGTAGSHRSLCSVASEAAGLCKPP